MPDNNKKNGNSNWDEYSEAVGRPLFVDGRENYGEEPPTPSDDDDNDYDDYDEDGEEYEDDEESGSLKNRLLSFLAPRNREGLVAQDEDYDEYGEDEYYDDEDEPEERDYRPVRFRRDGRRGIMGGFMYFIFIVSVSIVLTCMGWMAASDVLALNKGDHTAVVSVPDNFEMDDVITTLKDAGIIEYKFLFKMFAKISNADTKIAPGEYTLSTKYDYRALVEQMRAGSDSQQRTKITFPEGFTLKQIFERLEENGICSAADLEEAASTYNYTYRFLRDFEKSSNWLEGYLFPDTYEFYKGEQASNAINRFLSVFNYKLTADMLTQAENLGMSFHQVLTVASMVESEAADDDERATIASIIYNRLNTNMPLQIDATIQYFLPERKAYLTIADTQIDNPYNTYLYPGLPPGPISNPGIASINAALKPEQTNYYFYALDMETGKHRFFTNAYDHQVFVSTQDYSALQ